MRTVVHFTDSNAFGGTERILLSLLAGLNRGRWRPVLFYHPNLALTPLLDGARESGVDLRALPRMQGRQALPRMIRFLQALRAERPSVFHAHLSWPEACGYGVLAAALARTRAVIATEQLFLEPTRRGMYAQRILCLGIDRYIAVSDQVAHRLRERLRLPARKVRVIRNGIELSAPGRPANGRLRATLSRCSERPLVLAVARLHWQKGLRYLLEAAALVPEPIFLLAGEGPERAGLEAQARALNIDDRVVFLGHRDDVPDLLVACDLFVLPSLVEGLPLAVMEASAAGKPVIATAIGGTDEAVLHGKTGLLVPPADPAAMAGAIRLLLARPALANRLGGAAQARARREFAAETMIKRVTEVYEEVLASREKQDGVR